MSDFLKRHVQLWTFASFGLGISILGWDMVGMLVASLGLFVSGCGFLGALLPFLSSKSLPERLSPWLVRTLVWFAVAMVAVFINTSREAHALARAQQLREAVLAYEARHHRFPPELEALVPDFLTELPLARQTLLDQRAFSYQTWACPSCEGGCNAFGCIEGGSKTATSAAKISFGRLILEWTAIDVSSGESRNESY